MNAVKRRRAQKQLLAELRQEAITHVPAENVMTAERVGAPARGFAGPSRGASNPPRLLEYVGTSSQVCGLWPWSVGATAPLVGAPLGRHKETGALVCGDPYSYFQRLHIIRNPSMFMLANAGLGKSSVVRRMCTSMDAFGVLNLILGDIKPDYLVMTKALGGDVVSVGPGRDTLNVLDDGDVRDALALLYAAAEQARQHAQAAAEAIQETPARAELEALVDVYVGVKQFSEHADAIRAGVLDGTDEERRDLLWEFVRNRERYAETTDTAARTLAADTHERKKTLLSAIIAIARDGKVQNWEETLLDEAVTMLEERFTGDAIPEVQDVLNLIVEMPERFQSIVLSDDQKGYKDATRPLQQALLGLIRGGRFGKVFAGQSTVKIRRDRHLAIDISSVSDTNREMQAAVLITCWSMGFSQVNVSHALADAGLEPERIYHVVMDELHRALRTGSGMVDRLDMLTRVNRTEGAVLTQITHTMKDLESMPDPEDKAKARGFVERAGMVVLGGLPAGEMPALAAAGVTVSRREQEMLDNWSQGAAIDSNTGQAGKLPGMGNFMIKIGSSPAIPFELEFTATEQSKDVHDTNQRWHVASRHTAVGDVEEEVTGS